MEGRKTAKKRNYSDVEVDVLTSEVAKKRVVLFGSLKSGIKGAQKTKVWQRIADSVSSVALEQRTAAEV